MSNISISMTVGIISSYIALGWPLVVLYKRGLEEKAKQIVMHGPVNGGFALRRPSGAETS